MARSVNKVILLGNLGADPEVRFTPAGKQVATANLATSEEWTDKATGERKTKTEWHRLVFWEKDAEILGQYARKGSKLYVDGQLQTRSWEDQSGQKRYVTEIRVREFSLVDSGGQDQPAQPAQQPAPRRAAPSGPSRQPMEGPTDDDLPF